MALETSVVVRQMQSQHLKAKHTWQCDRTETHMHHHRTLINLWYG